ALELLQCVGFGAPHQFAAKTTSAHRRRYPERADVEPSGPDVSEQTAQHLAALILQKERNRIPLYSSGGRNIMIVDKGLHDIAQLIGRIRFKDYRGIVHRCTRENALSSGEFSSRILAVAPSLFKRRFLACREIRE